MGKLESGRKGRGQRHSPLERDLARDRILAKSPKKGAAAAAAGADEEDDDGNAFLSAAETKKIMRQARSQRDEVEREESGRRATGADDAGADEEEELEEIYVDDKGAEDLIQVEDGEWVEAGGVLSAAEERLMRAFMAGGGGDSDDEDDEDGEGMGGGGGFGGPRLLADIIMEKIKLQEMQASAAETAGDRPEIPEKVVQVYTEIGQILSHWGRVRVPKAFKIIPVLTNWEDILYLTRPDEWSPHSWFVATRLFASNLNEHMAQHFYAAFLLPKCMEDIQENKRLNYHLYASLQKAVYKPAAWVKGILLPLAQNMSPTLREAAIIGSVLAKTSLPMQHGAAAMLKLSKMRYNGVTSLFLRILLQKKYALPHRVIDSLVEHFCAFKDETRQLPVLWHQALLTLVQRYKESITRAQKHELKHLMRAQHHHLITTEVRRELFTSRSRGDDPNAPVQFDKMDMM